MSAKLFLVLLVVASSAFAHENTPLRVSADGVVTGGIPTELPKAFGPIHFKFDGFAAGAPKVQLSIRNNHIDLPECVARHIRTKRIADIQLSASWYHDEVYVPYYLAVDFYDPRYDEKRIFNSYFQLLFNLHDATLIEMKRFQAGWFGNGWKSRPVKLSAACRAAVEIMADNVTRLTK